MILAAALSAVLYFTTQENCAKWMTFYERLLEESAAEAELDLYSGQLEAIEKELVTERINTAESKRSEERLRAEIYTARREVSISNQELANAREKIEELESSGRRLRQNLVEIEQIFAKPDTKPEIDKLNARIFQLEEANLQLKKELHAAGQRKSSPRAYTIEAENRTSIESILTKDRLIIIRAKLENRFKEGEKITLLRLRGSCSCPNSESARPSRRKPLARFKNLATVLAPSRHCSLNSQFFKTMIRNIIHRNRYSISAFTGCSTATLTISPCLGAALLTGSATHRALVVPASSLATLNSRATLTLYPALRERRCPQHLLHRGFANHTRGHSRCSAHETFALPRV